MIASYLKPLLPLRDIVIFPSMVIPLFVGREKSIKALQEVMKTDKSIVLVTQKNSEIDDPTSKDLYQYGCLSKVLQLLKLPDGTVKVLVEGEKRIKILKHHESSNNYLTCEVEIADDQNKSKDLENMFTMYNHIVDAKHLIVKKLNKVGGLRTLLKTSKGYEVTGQEGFVAIDRYGKNALKLVDRLEFSKANFSDKYIKGWTK